MSAVERREIVMSKSKRRVQKSKVRRRSTKRSRLFKFPKAFRIVPIRMSKKSTSKGLLESGTPNPCPPPYQYVDHVKLNGQWFCECTDGVYTVLVACPPPA
jgi:hypothetical protein